MVISPVKISFEKVKEKILLQSFNKIKMNEHLIHKWRLKYACMITYVHTLHYDMYNLNILSYHKEEYLWKLWLFFITLKYCSCFSAFIVPSFSCLRQELKMKSSVSLSHPFSSLILTSSCLTGLPLSGESRSRGPNPLCPTIVSWIFSPRVF